MKTDDLIVALSADAKRQGIGPGLSLALATVGSAIIAATLFFSTIGVRPDFVAALGSLRFDFKFAVTLTVAGTALFLLHRCIYPVTSQRAAMTPLLLGPVFLLSGVVAELFALPGGAWAMASTGKNGLLCLIVIPLLGIVPLGLFILALRRGAPTRPTLAGLCAGLLSGGIAATLYAANCTDDSPLFVATWYPVAVGLLAAAGAIGGRILVRW